MGEYGMIEGESTITSNDLGILFFPRLYIENYYKKPVLPRPYCRFRDCLFEFCMRLDDDLHLKSKVVQMVNQSCKDGQTTRIGVAISRNQLVTVAADETGVRHSPALKFHDNRGGVQDGLLLLVYLLSPAMTVHKTPWTKALTTSFHGSSAILPEDVIRHILH
ncbi:transmembrane protein [Ceratobasidium sp. AG-Ba]|nr:transmembrane protein [Ceratobasidium sp. AG-Ba]QRW02577.1 transmembrane protein [Ceratobasidium sp. AG-Ba]